MRKGVSVLAITYNDLYLNTKSALRKVSTLGCTVEAREILRLATGKDRLTLARDAQMYVPDALAAEVHALLNRRLQGEPIAYLLGEWEFYGLTLEISPGVLIPRADTETLTDAALEALKARSANGSPLRLLDLCCGSGCVGLATLAEMDSLTVSMADIDEEALRITKRNVRRHRRDARCTVMRADVRNPAPPAWGRFDVITCNPPYIPTGELAGLDPSVRDYEPHLALDGGPDGLDFMRAVAEHWRSALAPDGVLLLEVGAGQAQRAGGVLLYNGFRNIRTYTDGGGIERVVGGSLPCA